MGGDDWGVILVGLVVGARLRPRLGRAQRLPDRQGADPGADRHARHAGHGARRRAAHHRRRRRARGAVQARSTTIGTGRAVRPDPVAGDHRLRGRDRLRRRSSPPRASAATRTRSAPTRRRRAAPASPSTATSSRSTRSPGTLAGLAGFLSLARFSTTTIGGHDTDNLQAIAAVVHRRHEPVRRHRDDARHRLRRLHPGRPAERLRDHRRAAVLAAGRGRRGAHRAPSTSTSCAAGRSTSGE